MYVEYDNETKRVTRMVSEDLDVVPKAGDGRTMANEPISPGSRREIKLDAISEADYDPETEQAIAKLYYDTETGEVYAEVEIRELEDEEELE